MIDTHAHLDFEQFDRDRDFVILRAQSTLRLVLNPTVNLESTKKALQVLKDYNFIYFCLGFHPHYADNFKEEVIEYYRDLIEANPRIVGIGEVGLDFYKSSSSAHTQIKVFEKFIKLAIDYHLPLVIHTRNAESKMIEVLKQYNLTSSLIFHCFSGSKELLEFALTTNNFLSFAGNITYRNNTLLRDSLKEMELSNLLLETDAPYLVPSSKRGQRNEPSFIFFTLNEVSNLLNIPSHQLEGILEENTFRVFKIKQKENERV